MWLGLRERMLWHKGDVSRLDVEIKGGLLWFLWFTFEGAPFSVFFLGGWGRYLRQVWQHLNLKPKTCTNHNDFCLSVAWFQFSFFWTAIVYGSLRSNAAHFFAVGPPESFGVGWSETSSQNGLQHFWLAVIKSHHRGVHRISYSLNF